MFDALMIDAWSVRPDLIFSNSELTWNIASEPSGRFTPNILSELSYRNMHATGIGTTLARLYPLNDDVALYADVHFSRASIHAGISQDSDYSANDRQGEFSRSYADINNDDNHTDGFNLGFKMRWLDRQHDFLNFFIGRQQQDMNITTTNGMIAFSDDFPTGFALDDLNSTYNSRFDAWSLGIGSEHQLTWGVISLRYDYDDTNFDAKANWNLREDFAHPVSFTHNGQGHGQRFQIGYSYPLTAHLRLHAHWQHSQYAIRNGYDQIFYIVGSETLAYVTRLNAVDYRSRQFQLGMEYLF
jgi:hypothetical protein